MIVLDANIYIYMANTDAPQRASASALLAALESREVPILIPTICVAEYLTKVPPTKRKDHLAVLAGIGTIVPFDIPSAIIAAEIHSNREHVKKAQETSTRKAILADIKLLATAIAHGAMQLYTHNVTEMQALAKAGHYGIHVSGIPGDPDAHLDLILPGLVLKQPPTGPPPKS